MGTRALKEGKIPKLLFISKIINDTQNQTEECNIYPIIYSFNN